MHFENQELKDKLDSARPELDVTAKEDVSFKLKYLRPSIVRQIYESNTRWPSWIRNILWNCMKKFLIKKIYISNMKKSTCSGENWNSSKSLSWLRSITENYQTKIEAMKRVRKKWNKKCSWWTRITTTCLYGLKPWRRNGEKKRCGAPSFETERSRDGFFQSCAGKGCR